MSAVARDDLLEWLADQPENAMFVSSTGTLSEAEFEGKIAMHADDAVKAASGYRHHRLQIRLEEAIEVWRGTFSGPTGERLIAWRRVNDARQEFETARAGQ